MEGRYFSAIYCPPNPPRDGYENRITIRSYRLLKEAGIDHVFGYYEDNAGKEYLRTALDCSYTAGIKFYPRMEIFNRFLGIDGAEGKDNVSFLHMNAEIRSKIEKEFVEGLSEWSEYPAFGGIFFGDERGCETFPGIGAAAELFKKYFPDKEFLYNNLNYFLDDKLFFYSTVPVRQKKILSGDLAYCVENRFRRYDAFMEKYFANVSVRYLSTDIYPFALTWKEVPASVHRGLYETCSMFAKYKEQRGVKCLIYVQVGNWDCNDRKVGYGEMALQMGIAAAYDFDGFVFFPGCFPNDWLGTQEAHAKDGKTALLDACGEPTEYFDYAKSLLRHFQKCAEYLGGAKWLGVKTIGKFVGGFDVKVIQDLPDWECIYRGDLPENERKEYVQKMPKIRTTSQLFIGVYEKNGSKMYLIVNNSVVTDVRFSIECEKRVSCIQNGEMKSSIAFSNSVSLLAGESVLIMEG